jgi:hypothetical protein
MSEIDDADLNTVLARAYPQGYAVLRFEGGTGIMRIGAREVIRNPVLARGTVAPRGLRAIARALRAVGQQEIACADRLDELAAEAEAGATSAPDRASAGATCNMETDR